MSTNGVDSVLFSKRISIHKKREPCYSSGRSFKNNFRERIYYMFKEQCMNKMGFLNNRVVIIAVLLYVAFMCVVEFRKELFQTSKGLGLSQEGPLFRPTCAVPRYSAVSLPVTGLVSFPGSGNIWMRHLVQEASGKCVLRRVFFFFFF